LRIGSRGSQLALWQAHHIEQLLSAPDRGCSVEIIHTSGDRLLDAPLAQFGGKGLFTKEIEEALFDRHIDLAVHSLKDVPTELPDGLMLGAILKREDARDALVAAHGSSLLTLKAAARVGTSSLRRQAQLANLRPDVQIVALRGNVDTRLRKLDAGDYDALLLASAGLRRLGKADRVSEFLEPAEFCPAVGQGALALECRGDDEEVRSQLRRLHDRNTAECVTAERALLRRLEAGCQAPVAAHATASDRHLFLRALVCSPDGKQLVRGELGGDRHTTSPEHIGERLADDLLKRGAAEILASIYGKTVAVPQIP
jgi:hydroxymethylbilane synthase